MSRHQVVKTSLIMSFLHQNLTAKDIPFTYPLLNRWDTTRDFQTFFFIPYYSPAVGRVGIDLFMAVISCGMKD